MGVIGTGKIGRIFIDICRGFGMNVIAYDRFPAKDGGTEYVSIIAGYPSARITRYGKRLP